MKSSRLDLGAQEFANGGLAGSINSLGIQIGVDVGALVSVVLHNLSRMSVVSLLAKELHHFLEECIFINLRAYSKAFVNCRLVVVSMRMCGEKTGLPRGIQAVVVQDELHTSELFQKNIPI